MENVGVNYTYPAWKMLDQSLLDSNQNAMTMDQLTNSHPIMADVKDPAQINSLFDSISYDKVTDKNLVVLLNLVRNEFDQITLPFQLISYCLKLLFINHVPSSDFLSEIPIYGLVADFIVILVNNFTSHVQGAAIIRMLEDVIGKDVFFQGLQHYLQTYKFSNAATNDLWQCLTQEAKKRKVQSQYFFYIL